jgi:dihydropteroate synthase
MVADGADLLDVGGESTRPGAEPLGAADELRRVLPVVEALAARVSVPISIDTYKPAVAEAALRAGASLVNDISGLRYEPDLARVAADHRAAIVLMHTRGRSRDMYEHAVYHEVIDEVIDELRESVAFAAGAGIPPDRIIVDPGLGFAKDAAHTYETLARLDELSECGRPILVGPSRKRFLTRPLDGVGRTLSRPPGAPDPPSQRFGEARPTGSEIPATERDWATAAAVAAAVFGGAHIVRVHAVRAMAQVARVSDEIRKYHRG